MEVGCIKVAFAASIVTLYAYLTCKLSHEVNITSEYLVDEFFHIPQGLAYCNHEFKTWDPKITTLPGLYLYSTALCSPLKQCNSLCLRFSNNIASCMNIILFILLRKLMKPTETFGKVLLNSFNIALLPPLYFFSQTYYTDVSSLMVVLALIYFSLTKRSIIASFFGLAAFVFRQTNIVYVGFIIGLLSLELIWKTILSKQNEILKNAKVSQKDRNGSLLCSEALSTICSSIIPLLPEIIIAVGPYCCVIITFICFVIWNGGIVVGDKDAHSATLNVPQLFYFSIFTLFFTWPHFLKYIKQFLYFIFKFPYKTIVMLLLIAVTIAANTIVHPYLLADNRHYTFYMWRYFFNTPLWRALWAPIYFFALYCIYQVCRSSNNICFTLIYPITLILAVCLQKLLDVRYFFAPFVILRLQYPQTSFKILSLETTFHAIVNYVAYKNFFTKEIYWQDITEVQRLIW